MMETESQQKFWLIRSSTRVLGPYTIDEVFNLLKNKHVSLLDEIRTPNTRWVYIREHKELSEVLKKLKDFEAPSDRTHTAMTNSQTISKTENIYDIEDDHVDQTMVRNFYPPQKEQAEIKEITAVKENPISSGSSITYGVYDEALLKIQAEEKTKKVRLFLFSTLGVLIVIFLGYQYWLRSQRTQNYQNMVASAQKFKSLQLYEKAYESFRRSQSIFELEPEMKAQMSMLGIHYDKDLNKHKKNIQDFLLKDQNIERSDRVDYLTVLGLISSLEGNTKKAEDYNKQALLLDPFNRSVLINQSVLKIKKNLYTDAFINLKKISSNELNPVITFVKAFAFARIGSSMQDEINSLYNEINQISKFSLNYSPELALLKIQLVQNSSIKSRQNDAYEQFIKSTPQISRKFVSDYRLNVQSLDWNELKETCDKVSAVYGDMLKLNLTHAHCLLNAGQVLEAQKFVDEAFALAPEDAGVINTQIHWLYLLQKSTEANALVMVHQKDLFPSTKVIAGSIAISRSDFDFAEKILKEVLTSESHLGPAYHQLALIALKRGKIGMALQNIKFGLDREPNYLPLLELRESLESKD